MSGTGGILLVEHKNTTTGTEFNENKKNLILTGTNNNNVINDGNNIINNIKINNLSGHLVDPPTTTSNTTSIVTPPTTVAVENIDQHCRLLEEENDKLKEAQTKLQQQCNDAQRRERILMRRLANKEQEFQDYASQIAEYKAAQAPGPAALRTALLDPAVNLLFDKLKKELQATKAKLEETQNELSAWKFTPDSNTGKRLMAKCRLLYQENEELGKMTSNGRLAKLEGELSMQKSFSEEVKKSQSELDDFLQELDEDVEGMQSTILFLQQELKTTRDRIIVLEKDNIQLKNGTQDDSPKSLVFANGKNSDDNISLPIVIELDESYEKFNSSDEDISSINNKTTSSKIQSANNFNKNNDTTEIDINGINSENVTSTTAGHDLECNTGDVKKRGYESDSNESGSTNGSKLRSNKKLKKTSRRASIVSNNEDESQSVPGEDEEVITRRKSARNQQNGVTEN